MRNPKRITLVVVTAVLLLILITIPFKAYSQNYVDLRIVEIVRIENNGDKVFSLEDFVNASLYHNSSQQIAVLVSLKCNGTELNRSQIKYDEDGNPYVEIELPIKEIGPGESVEFSAITKVRVYERSIQGPKFSIENSGTLDDIPKELKEKYTANTKLYQTKNEELIQLAMRIKGNETNVLKIVLLFLNWTEHNIRYPFGELRPPSYPNETYKSGVGDCDDQANLLVTLCRIVGIPAITQGGLVFLPRNLLTKYQLPYGNGMYEIEFRRGGGHGWALVYIPPWKWVAVDCTFFEGAYTSSEGYIRSENLLDHIIGAAFYKRYVIVSFNVTVSDYVKESREWLADLDQYSLHWYEKLRIEISPFETTTTPTYTYTNITAGPTTPTTTTSATTMTETTPEKTRTITYSPTLITTQESPTTTKTTTQTTEIATSETAPIITKTVSPSRVTPIVPFDLSLILVGVSVIAIIVLSVGLFIVKKK